MGFAKNFLNCFGLEKKLPKLFWAQKILSITGKFFCWKSLSFLFCDLALDHPTIFKICHCFGQCTPKMYIFDNNVHDFLDNGKCTFLFRKVSQFHDLALPNYEIVAEFYFVIWHDFVIWHCFLLEHHLIRQFWSDRNHIFFRIISTNQEPARCTPLPHGVLSFLFRDLALLVIRRLSFFLDTVWTQRFFVQKHVSRVSVQDMCPGKIGPLS